jgi:hypothetical protein
MGFGGDTVGLFERSEVIVRAHLADQRHQLGEPLIE